MKVENKPFRITIEHWDEKISVEMDHSDLDLDQVSGLLQRALMATGFDPESIKELFVEV
jgi:hypothetical protein